MSTIKCVETRGYKLTVDKEYDVLREEDSWYILINDNNKQVRYSKELFEGNTVEEVVVPTRRTEADMIASIRWSPNTVSFTDIDNNERTVTTALAFADTSISCGINQVYGIVNLIDRIQAVIPQDDDYLDLQKAILRKFIEKQIIENTGKAIFIMSTNTTEGNDDEDERYDEERLDDDLFSVLDEMAEYATEEFRNPNSNNLIKMWTFVTNFGRDEV